MKSLVAEVISKALKAGATDAEAVVSEGDEFSVSVRMGEVETLQESGSRGLGLRVYLGQRSASASTSDLTPDGIGLLVSGALALVKVTEEDPFSGLPDAHEFGQLENDLRLYFDDVYSLPATERIDRARRAEAAALAFDPRITNSQGGSFDAATGRRGAGQLAWLSRRLPDQLLRHLRRAAGDGRRWRDAAGLLVFECQAHCRLGIAGVDWGGSSAACSASAWSKARSNPAGTHRLCARSSALADRAYL